MKIQIGLIALLLNVVGLAQASDLNCKTLSTNVAVSLGKANSGSVMRLHSVKQISVENTAASTKTYTFEVLMKDPNIDAYDSYRVTAQTFSSGGCLVKKVEMLQYD